MTEEKVMIDLFTASVLTRLIRVCVVTLNIIIIVKFDLKII